MDADDAVPLLLFAMHAEEEEKLFLRWVQGAQNVMSFSEFKNKLSQPKFKDTQEVLDDVGTIIDSMHSEIER